MVEAWLPLPILPMYNHLIVTIFCYNTDSTMDLKTSVITRFQCNSIFELLVEKHRLKMRISLEDPKLKIEVDMQSRKLTIH